MWKTTYVSLCDNPQLLRCALAYGHLDPLVVDDGTLVKAVLIQQPRTKVALDI